MTRHTLLFVAGSSPQIITETVAALSSAGVAVGDVHVLTTEVGRRYIEDRLFGRERRWKTLVASYPKVRQARFSPKNIVVLRDARGASLTDVRSQADNVAAADQIAHFVAGLTGPDQPPLHASIAGGRKTMGYLLAAAMMLYGRREDRMSHVLVHPPELEGTDFYFPPHPKRGRIRYRRPDGTAGSVPAKEVQVELADLPFPRLRAAGDMDRARNRSFSDLVSDLQAILEITTHPVVSIRTADDVVVCCGREVRLAPMELAIYAELAERRRSGCGREDCAACARCFVAASEIGGPFRDALRARLKERSKIGVDVRPSADSWLSKSFRPAISHINQKIEEVLHEGGKPFRIRSGGRRKRLRYGLALRPDQIEIL